MPTNIPPEAKPHEISILLVYSLGITRAEEIRVFLHYETTNPVYKTLRKYKEFLPECRMMVNPLVRMS